MESSNDYHSSYRQLIHDVGERVAGSSKDPLPYYRYDEEKIKRSEFTPDFIQRVHDLAFSPLTITPMGQIVTLFTLSGITYDQLMDMDPLETKRIEDEVNKNIEEFNKALPDPDGEGEGEGEQ